MAFADTIWVLHWQEVVGLGVDIAAVVALVIVLRFMLTYIRVHRRHE